ncbi:MAG: transcriptional repressor LexA [Coriobacteriia bacterium]|nr:transcriptional repressor LexA [Coriobacteriia bacterium]
MRKKQTLYTAKATANCQEILQIIKDFIADHDYSPTARDIMKRTKLKSVSSVHAYIIELENKGLITREDNKSRSIKLSGSAGTSPRVDLPVVGDVAAGTPILAEQNISENVTLPADLAGRGNFILKVRGNSMIDAGIYDGDKVIVRQQKTIKNGEIAVVLLGDEATVKRFYKEKDHFRLQPENKRMKPIIVDECELCGKVIGLYRSIR